jgi:glycosyltransferase involved in cell wall biosynthesis
MSPLVSVIVPTRDRTERLPAALDAIFRQTLADLEVIVVDDGSTDDTPAVLSAWAERDARLRIIRLETSGGPSAARNVAISKASGAFLAFADDDDEWFPNKLQTQMDFLASDPSVGAVTCFYELLDERAGRASPFRGPTRYSARALLWANFPATNLGVVRRSSFAIEPLFDESLTTCEDWDYWVQCSRDAGVATVPEILGRVVFHGQAQSAFDVTRRSAGQGRFVAKHRVAMSDDCLTYHAARGKLVATARERDRLLLHARYLLTLPWRIRRMIAAETLSARRGIRQGDPARGLRTLLELVEVDP